MNTKLRKNVVRMAATSMIASSVLALAAPAHAGQTDSVDCHPSRYVSICDLTDVPRPDSIGLLLPAVQKIREAARGTTLAGDGPTQIGIPQDVIGPIGVHRIVIRTFR